MKSSYARRLWAEQLEDRRMLAVLTVTNLDDAGAGSLRTAITNANNTAGADTIEFAADLTGTIELASQLPTISDSLTINGPGQTLLTLDAGDGVDNQFNTGDGFRIFDIDDGTDGLIDVEIFGLTLTGGDTANGEDAGGFIFDRGDGVEGGAIRTLENLTLRNSTVTGNATGDGESGYGLLDGIVGDSGGFGGDGGGIASVSGNLTLINSTVSGNTTGNGGDGADGGPYGYGGYGGNGGKGGGIASVSGNLTLISSTVSGNTAGNGGNGGYAGLTSPYAGPGGYGGYGGEGGGIAITSGSLILVSSEVSGNTTGKGGSTASGGQGGGISAYEGAVTLTNSTVSGNSSSGAGGGISSQIAIITLINSAVSENSSSSAGGGILSPGGAVTLTNSAVNGNNSSADGGGILTSGGAVTLTNSTVSGNSSSGAGGGIDTAFGVVTLTNSTVTANDAGSVGGGIFFSNLNTNPALTIQNTIVAGNSAQGVANDITPDPNSVVTINNSLIGVADTIPQPITGDVGNLTGTSAMPLNPLLGPLANNGGPTQTHALLPGSPAINGGDVGLLPSDTDDLDGDGDATEPIPFDQRGLIRNAEGGVDIGAFELQSSPATLPGDFNRDLVVNALDYLVFRDTLGASVPNGTGADGDGDGAVTAADFNVFVANFGAGATPPVNPATAAAITAGETDEASRDVVAIDARAVPVSTPAIGTAKPSADVAEAPAASPAEAVDDRDLLLSLALSSAEQFEDLDRADLDVSAFDEAFANEEDKAEDALVLSLSSL